jgi:catechol 2,3-dioxygenase-like lactoylglutathione lyase family enzyme
MNLQRKKSFFGITHLLSIGTAVLVTLSTSLYAQGVQSVPAERYAGPRAVDVSILHLNVLNLDQSLLLYRDLLGMEVIKQSGNPAPTGLVNEPGALMRTVVLEVPGGSFQMELVEFSGIALQPQQPRIQDPGAIMLAMRVWDIDAKMAGVRKLGLQVLTSGGEPLISEGRGGRTRTVMVRDPDGFVVELVEDGGIPDTAQGSISNVSVYLSVKDLEQTVTFYNQALGFTMPEPSEARPTPERIQAFFGDTGLVTMRLVRGTFPGTVAPGPDDAAVAIIENEFTITFQEFRGSDQRQVRHRVQDPGGPILLVSVQEFPAVIEAVQANGGTVGLGEISEALAPEAQRSWVRDPNGLLMLVSPLRAPNGSGVTPASQQ